MIIFYEVLDSMKAEFMALKSLLMNDLYDISWNTDKVQSQQCDQRKQLEGNSRYMWKEIATKNTIIKSLSENLKLQIIFYKTNSKTIIARNQENRYCELPKDSFLIRSTNKKFI